jgi:protein TonB
MTKGLLLLLCFLGIGISLSAQANFSVTTTREATYPGGDQALYAFMHKNMKYPEQAKADKLEGDIYVSFFVEADSSVSNVSAMSDLGSGTKEEAIRLVKMLRFAPALQNGKPIRSNMMIPVLFRIYDK